MQNELFRQIEQRILKKPSCESCGLLIGSIKEDKGCVEEAVFIRNLSDEPDQFSMDTQQVSQAMANIGNGKVLIGIFHSHRGATKASKKDIEGMRISPIVWLIFGLNGSSLSKDVETRAYIFSDNILKDVLVVKN